MRLLVSVRNASEAEAALAGGADIIDAKEPLNGPLGPVAPVTLHAITTTVGGKAPVSVALGDIGTDDVRARALTIARAGISFVKIGFAGARNRSRLAADVRAAAASIGSAGLVLVAYADYERADAPSPEELIALTDATDAAGVLLDTYNKDGSALTTLMTPRELQQFVTRARRPGRVVAVAGQLTAPDIESVHAAGADILGVRGAACDGGRAGIVTADRVRELRRQVDRTISIAC